MHWKRAEVDTDEGVVDFSVPSGETFEQMFEIVDMEPSDVKELPK